MKYPEALWNAPEHFGTLWSTLKQSGVLWSSLEQSKVVCHKKYKTNGLKIPFVLIGVVITISIPPVLINVVNSYFYTLLRVTHFAETYIPPR